MKLGHIFLLLLVFLELSKLYTANIFELMPFSPDVQACGAPPTVRLMETNLSLSFTASRLSLFSSPRSGCVSLLLFLPLHFSQAGQGFQRGLPVVTAQ